MGKNETKQYCNCLCGNPEISQCMMLDSKKRIVRFNGAAAREEKGSIEKCLKKQGLEAELRPEEVKGEPVLVWSKRS